jgi:hypothetical protein
VRCGKTEALPGQKQCDDCRAYVLARYHGVSDETRIHRSSVYRTWAKHNPDALAARDARYRNRLRQAILSHYGTACECCGEDNPSFLTLDHIDGDGNTHRRSLFSGKNVSGNAFYQKIRSLGFPPGLQTLCWNCNMAKAHYGTCPHAV